MLVLCPVPFLPLTHFSLAIHLAYPVFHLSFCSPVVHTVEFQKRGLPHARILVWQQKNSTQVITPAFIDSSVSTTVSISIGSSFLFQFFCCFPLAWFPMVNLALPQGSKLTDVDDDTAATALAKTMETALAQPPRLKMYALSLQ